MYSTAKLLLTVSLSLSASLFAASSKSASLSVTIRPAAAITVQGVAAVAVKIRLNAEAEARLWKDETCGAAPARSYTIGQSGTYNLNLAQIEGTGSRLCLATSDGTLTKSIRLPAIPTPAGQ